MDHGAGLMESRKYLLFTIDFPLNKVTNFSFISAAVNTLLVIGRSLARKVHAHILVNTISLIISIN